MKLARYEGGVGVVHDDTLLPRSGGDLLWLAANGGGFPSGDPVPLADVRLLPPLAEPPSIRDFYAFEQHVATARRTRGLEMEPDWYELPVFYFTNPAAVIGPDGEVRAPTGCEELDYELEVACVIGLDGGIAGFTIMNDWSARDLQRREMKLGLGPAKGKDFATALGPYLVTTDELPGFDTGRPSAEMVARVNGREYSRGQLADIHHSWPEILEYTARDTRLRPGDVIGSGTVGTGCILELSLVHGSSVYPWLRPGDVVELEVERLGVLRNTVGS